MTKYGWYEGLIGKKRLLATVLVLSIVIGFSATLIRSLKPQSHIEYDVPAAETKSQESTGSDEPLLTRIFWILREPGSSITLGPCPGEKCLKLVLGKLEQKESVLVQRIYIEAEFLKFKKHPKYPDIKIMNSMFHSKGCALVYSIDGSKIWFELALSKGKMCEVFSRVSNIRINVLDTRTDSLRIKLEVFPGKKPSLPFDAKGTSKKNKDEKIEKQVKSGLNLMTQLLEEGDMQGGLLEIEKLMKLVKKEQHPKLYGKLNLNKGYCYLEMGIEKNSAETIKKAINIFKAGERVFASEQEKCPVECAKLHTNLGTAYFRLSTFENQKTNLGEAISAYEKALVAFEELGISEHHDRLESNLTVARDRLNNLE